LHLHDHLSVGIKNGGQTNIKFVSDGSVRIVSSNVETLTGDGGGDQNIYILPPQNITERIQDMETAFAKMVGHLLVSKLSTCLARQLWWRRQ